VEAYTTANPFFWITMGVLALWLLPCFFWGNAIWWAWTRKIEDGPGDQLWIGWLEISKAMVFGRWMDADKRQRMLPLLKSLEELPKQLNEQADKPNQSV